MRLYRRPVPSPLLSRALTPHCELQYSVTSFQMDTPLIGSRISLISKNEIRYEGILYDINKQDTTIALKDVRSFGTENRQADKVVPPNDKTYDFIKFRGIDIRDLHVHKSEDAANAAMQPPQMRPPPPPQLPPYIYP